MKSLPHTCMNAIADPITHLPARKGCGAWRALFLLLLALGLLAPGAQAQTDFPARPVTILLPFPPGGLADAALRRMAARLAEVWKVPVLVDNRPGAGGFVGAAVVAKGPTDGHLLLYTVSESLSIAKAARANVGFDPVADLTPVALVVSSSTVLVVNAESPHRSFRDFVEFGRRNPGKLSFGIQGQGSSFHLALEQLNAMTGAALVGIPYKGAAPMVTDLLAARIDGMIISTSVVLPYVRSGKLRALAVASAERVKELEGIPTIAESGYGPFDAPVGLGVYVRSGTGKALTDRLAADIRRVMAEPASLEWLASMLSTTTALTPDEFRARTLREVAHYQALIEKAKIKFEN